METQIRRQSSLLSRRNLHQRQLSDSSALIGSPSENPLSLRLENIKTEPSPTSSVPNSPLSTLRSHKEVHKPISLVIIEKYFSDICHSMSTKEEIEKPLLSKASTMQEVLKDCLTAVPDISLQFYVLMTSALKEIQEIYLSNEPSLYTALSKKLVQIADMIENNKFTSEVERVNTQSSEEIIEVRGIIGMAKELGLRVTRVTARILNLWKKILSPQREAAVISCSFLLLYCEVDSTINILPTTRVPADKAVCEMKAYLNNPGHVVTIVRKTREFIDKEMISVETIRRIHDLMSKITVEQVKTMDKTLTGFVLYDFVLFAIMYYRAYAKEHYSIDIFEKIVGEQQEFAGGKERPVEVSDDAGKKIERKSNETPKDFNQARIIEEAKERVSEPQRSIIRAEIENPAQGLKNSESQINAVRSKAVRPSEPSIDHEKEQRLTGSQSNSTLEREEKAGNILTKNAGSNKRLQESPEKPSKIPLPSKMKVPTSPTKLPTSPSKKPLQQQRVMKKSASPSKPSATITNRHQTNTTPTNSSRPLDKNIFKASRLITSEIPKTPTNCGSPVRSRIVSHSPSASLPCPSHRDMLEELHYQQYIEEKFRHFLVDKLRLENEKYNSKGLEPSDTKIIVEVNAGRNRKDWVEEFEKGYGRLKFDATKKLMDEKIYNAEVIRAQRQLEIILKFDN